MILDEQKEPCGSVCPICLASSYQYLNAYCKGRDCMWWITEKNDCAIKVIAKGVSNNEKIHR